MDLVQHFNDIKIEIDFKAEVKRMKTLLIMFFRDKCNTFFEAGRIYRKLLASEYPKGLLDFWIADIYRKFGGGPELTYNEFNNEDFLRYKKWYESKRPNIIRARTRIQFKDEFGTSTIEIGDYYLDVPGKVLSKAIRIHECMVSRMFEGTLDSEFLPWLFEYAPVWK